MIQLFSAVLCVVRAVHKFDFRLVINETSNKRRPMEEGHAVIVSRVFDRICMFSPRKSS
jgi:hypothetical protein